MAKRIDRVEIREDFVTYSNEGFIRSLAAVTRTGVFVYQNPDGTLRRELRHPDDVFLAESLKTLKMIPVTNEHPTELVTAENAKALSIGSTGETVRPDGKLVLAPVMITDIAAIKEIERGKREFSCGYEVDLVEEDGLYGNEQYDYRQTNIRYNHLALVQAGRAGRDVRLKMDSDDGILVTAAHAETINGGAPLMTMRKVTLDGIEYDAAHEVANALRKAEERADNAEAKLKGFVEVKLDGGVVVLAEPKAIEALDRARADADASRAELEKIKNVDRSDEIQKAVKERVRVLDFGKSTLPKETVANLDSMSDIDIQKAVILDQADKADRDTLQQKLDAASETYIRARFDQVVENLPKRDSRAIAGQREKVIPDPASRIDNDEKSAEARRDSMEQKVKDRYKNLGKE